MRFVRLPAIVIRYHRQGRVGDFRFARAFGFAQVRHANDIVAEIMIGHGLGSGAECGAFHVHVGAAVVRARAQRPAGLQQPLPQFLADRVGEGDAMSHGW